MNQTSEKREAQLTVDLLARQGMRHAVISPGSRHAPLTLSFHAHPSITCYVVPDERAAAYFALGIAQLTRTAVALVCTSGTAAMNYGPALAEAFYQEVPLIALTADRPKEWVDQGDGQTIRQLGLHRLHTLGSFELHTAASHPDEQRNNERIINAAWNIAHGHVKGPVHVNVPFREPLYGVTQGSASDPTPIHRHLGEPMPTDATFQLLNQRLLSASKVMVIAGMGHPDADLNEALSILHQGFDALIFTETGANLPGDHCMASIDRLLMALDDEATEALIPEILITFGSNIVSKKIKALLRKQFRGEHWHIDPAGRPLDTFNALTDVVQTSPRGFFDRLNAGMVNPKPATYSTKWLQIDRQLAEVYKGILEQTPWSDLSAFKYVLSALPPNSILQMGNSSVVRYIQLFDMRPDLVYYGNRGTSGIDGCTATASGMAAVADKTVTLITGDIAFLYDVNGLWHSGNRDQLRIVLINNGGGNIFKIIDGPSSSDALERYFEARHQHTGAHFARHFGIAYLEAHSEDELATRLQQLYAEQRCALLEIHTEDVPNEDVLKSMFKSLKHRYEQR